MKVLLRIGKETAFIVVKSMHGMKSCKACDKRIQRNSNYIARRRKSRVEYWYCTDCFSDFERNFKDVK